MRAATVPAQLGQRVRFTQVLQRMDVKVGARARHERHWLSVERAGEGVLVGYRTQSNGYTEWWGPEEGSEWRQTGTVRCALVATNLYRNPERVPLEALEVVG